MRVPRTSGTTIYGVHPVVETLKAGKRRVERIFLARELSSAPEFNELSASARIPVKQVTQDELDSIARSPHHQGVAARVGEFPYLQLEDVISAPWDSGRPLLLLDGVQDPANLGNILRSAECLGAVGVVITKDRSAPVTAAVEKAAAGAAAHVPVIRVVNLARTIEGLKRGGCWVYGTAADAGTTLYSLKLDGRLCFVLGSEGKGMRRLVRETCDGLLGIPMYGKVTSLNVSQMATIVLAECQRQRLTQQPD